MIRQVKPPALFSVDLSNVPAASCSIIMASSPLLLRRQCLSPLGPSRPYSPTLFCHHLILQLRRVRLIVFSFSFVPSPLTPRPSSSSSSLSSCTAGAFSPLVHLAAARRLHLALLVVVPLRWSYERAAGQLHLLPFLVGPPRRPRRPRRRGNEDNEDRL